MAKWSEVLSFLLILKIVKSPSILSNDLGIIINLECKFKEFRGDMLLLEVVTINMNNNPVNR